MSAEHLGEERPRDAARRSPPRTCRVPARHCPRKAGRRQDSGSKPYFEGPKSAACVLARKTAASARDRFSLASPIAASAITPNSKHRVQIVTVRLL